MKQIVRRHLAEAEEGAPAPVVKRDTDAVPYPKGAPVRFEKPFTPQQKAAQKKALVEALRKRSAEQ